MESENGHKMPRSRSVYSFVLEIVNTRRPAATPTVTLACLIPLLHSVSLKNVPISPALPQKNSETALLKLFYDKLKVGGKKSQ